MSVETYYKRNLAAMDENLKRDLADNETLHGNQAKVIKENYGLEIDTKNQAYDEDLRANEVQKFINMREVAENNANLGLTDSGLNRTQSTAVQLSASNNAAKIERDRNNMVRALEVEMNRYLTEIENSRISSAASIKKGYEDSAMSSAVDMYKADVDAAAKASEARISAKNSLFEKLTNDEISDANKEAYIKSFISDYGFSDEIETLLNNAGYTTVSRGADFTGTTYDDALQKMKSEGVSPDIYVGLMTSKEWSRRKASYKHYGTGSDEVVNYGSYKEYLADYVSYAIETAGKYKFIN